MSYLMDTLLETDAERAAECARHDEHQRSETRRVLAGEPYLWPQVKFRGDRRQQPKKPDPSRFGGSNA